MYIDRSLEVTGGHWRSAVAALLPLAGRGGPAAAEHQHGDQEQAAQNIWLVIKNICCQMMPSPGEHERGDHHWGEEEGDLQLRRGQGEVFQHLRAVTQPAPNLERIRY